MKYRVLYYDGCNGWRLGDVVDAERAHKEATGSRNEDGLLEDEGGERLWVPLGEGFETNPACEGVSDELDDEDRRENLSREDELGYDPFDGVGSEP